MWGFACHLFVQAQLDTNLIDYSRTYEFEIADVRVEGARFLDPRILATLSGLVPGDKLKVPGEQIPKAIKTLWRQRLFTNVSIEVEKFQGNKAYLVIKVEERPRISRYSIKGIKNSESEELRKKLELRAGQIFTENLRSLTINTCKNYFIDKGFLGVTVEVTETPDTLLANSVLVKINIRKGEKVKIDHINFYGNHQLNEAKLRRQMKETRERVKFDIDGLLRVKQNLLRDSVRLRWYAVPGGISPSVLWEYASRYVNLNIFKQSKFKRDDYEADKRKIIEYYNNKGYRDAKIVWDSVYQTDAKNLNIDIEVSEGRRYYFRNIYFKGNTKYPDSLLARIVNIKRGEVYSQKLLEERIFMNPNGGDLSSLYMDDGYLFFNVTPLEVLVENDSVDIELRIHEGAQATIRDVRIVGNTKTNEKVIRRELRTLPGNKFSRTDLIRSQREIVNLGYFDPAQLDVVPMPNPENGTVDIEYRVTEKPSDQLELSAGWGGRATANTAGGLFGTLGVNFTNFSVRNIIDKKAWTPLPAGDGQRLSVRINSNGRAFQSYIVSFTEPWLGGRKPLSLDFAFNRFRANNFATTDFSKIIGRYFSTSVYLGLATRVKWPDDWFTVSAGLEFQHYILDNYGAFFIFSNGRSTNLNAQFTLARDSRALAAPTFYESGTFLSAQVKVTLPYSYIFPSIRRLPFESDTLSTALRYRFVEYHKWKLLFEWYMPVIRNKKLVFKASALMGFLGLYNPRIGYSPFERVEFGGDGLSNLNMGTQLGRDIVSFRGYQIMTPQGGSPIYNKYSLELRYLFTGSQQATIYGLIFADAGNYWNNIRDYRPYDLARSFGAGVRVFLPMFGLLGFDYGLGIDRARYGQLNQGNSIFAKYGAFRIILGREPE
ncbi:MAG: POTRA domain-containing protein [Chitinophagales bacterium]|nr:POTRA domain-containing protein [Chitinophagales bacterium]